MLATLTEVAKTWEATGPPERLPRPEDGTRTTAITLQGGASLATRVTGQEEDTQQTAAAATTTAAFPRRLATGRTAPVRLQSIPVHRDFPILKFLQT